MYMQTGNDVAVTVVKAIGIQFVALDRELKNHKKKLQGQLQLLFSCLEGFFSDVVDFVRAGASMRTDVITTQCQVLCNGA